jgi:heptosyltransferase II
MILDGDVLVVRLPNWLGDTVMALPALAALRAARPGALLTAVGPWAPLLTGQAVADVLLKYPRDGRARRKLSAAMRAMRPDAAVLLPNSFESALAARRWGARIRLGYDADMRHALLTHMVDLPSPRRHQVDEYAGLLEAADIPVKKERPEWRLGEDGAAEAEVTALLTEAGYRGAGSLIGLHLGAAFGSSKLWPPASYAELIGQLAERGFEPLLMGGPEDLGVAGAVQDLAGSRVASTVGRDRAQMLPRLLARLTCLVSSDTGVAHLAAALGVPTVTLFGPTDPHLSAPRGRWVRSIEGPAPCAPCFLPRCPIEHVCMRAISAASVAAAVYEARAA